MSLRDWQHRTTESLQGKVFDRSTPLGPLLVTPDELDDARDLQLTFSVDDTIWQSGSTKDLLFSPAELVSYCSTFITLQPGDIFLTRTPGKTRPSSKIGSNATLSGPDNGELDVAGTLDITAGTFTWGDLTSAVADMEWRSAIGGKGTVVISSGATVQAGGGECHQRYDGTDDYLGGCLSLTPAIRNDGTVRLDDGIIFRDSALPWTNDGTLSLNDASTDPFAAVGITGGCYASADYGIGTCDSFTLSNTPTGAFQTLTGTSAFAATLSGTLLDKAGTVHLAYGLTLATTDWTAPLGGS